MSNWTFAYVMLFIVVASFVTGHIHEATGIDPRLAGLVGLISVPLAIAAVVLYVRAMMRCIDLSIDALDACSRYIADRRRM